MKVTKTLMKQLAQITHPDPKEMMRRGITWVTHYEERQKAIEKGHGFLLKFDRAFAGQRLW